MKRPLAALLSSLALAALVPACSETEGGLYPAGADDVSPLAEERFVKRLYLDLSGLQPTDAELASAIATLEKRGNIAAARGLLADDLIDRPTFAGVFVAELENDVFSGTPKDQVFTLFCSVLAAADPACTACAGDAADPCTCSCASVAMLAAEKTSLAAAADDLAAGAATGDIARRYAATQIFRDNAGSVEGVADSLFDTFLGRPAEPDEVKNVRALVFGSLVPGSPAGMLFHRLGEDYDDLVDIVFGSEVYREAAVAGVFQRYLGRPPSGPERTAFVGLLDPAAVDVRPIVKAVVSSGEYFAQ